LKKRSGYAVFAFLLYIGTVILREQDFIVGRPKPGEMRRSPLVELAPIARQQALKE
jgi:hypothetical protein